MAKSDKPAIPVKVITVDLATGKQTGEREIDYRQPGHQAWLSKHLFWCFHNKHGAQLLNATDSEPVQCG